MRTRDKEPEGGSTPTRPQRETANGGGKQHRGNPPAKKKSASATLVSAGAGDAAIKLKNVRVFVCVCVRLCLCEMFFCRVLRV